MKPVKPLPVFALLLAGALSACGTAYEVPAVTTTALAEAHSVIQEENLSPHDVRRTPDDAVALYAKVVERLEPSSEAFCRREHPDKEPAFCDYSYRVAREDSPPNAYQRRSESGIPIISVNPNLLMIVKGEDELAFVLGHEAAHQISDHLGKRKQQRLAGSLILGALASISQAYGNPSDTESNRRVVAQAMAAGDSIGRMAYSQSYELEADTLATYIVSNAGYDPAVGARVFARLDDAPASEEAMSLWSSHPASPERIATVLTTVAEIHAQSEMGVAPMPRVMKDRSADLSTGSGYGAGAANIQPGTTAW